MYGVDWGLKSKIWSHKPKYHPKCLVGNSKISKLVQGWNFITLIFLKITLPVLAQNTSFAYLGMWARQKVKEGRRLFVNFWKQFAWFLITLLTRFYTNTKISPVSFNWQYENFRQTHDCLHLKVGNGFCQKSLSD